MAKGMENCSYGEHMAPKGHKNRMSANVMDKSMKMKSPAMMNKTHSGKN
jgi:hypothetical protein